jgi:hypothetical protein
VLRGADLQSAAGSPIRYLCVSAAPCEAGCEKAVLWLSPPADPPFHGRKLRASPCLGDVLSAILSRRSSTSEGGSRRGDGGSPWRNRLFFVIFVDRDVL